MQSALPIKVDVNCRILFHLFVYLFLWAIESIIICVRLCVCLSCYMCLPVCTCVSVFVMTSRRLHDGHNISDYSIDTANAASTFRGGGKPKRPQHPSCSCDTSSVDVEKYLKIAPTSHAKGSSAGCVQISFEKANTPITSPIVFNWHFSTMERS